jgi:serine phosphatase RsbU (regulator of sigma subunit)
MSAPAVPSELPSQSFQLAHLRSECARVTALLTAFACLLAVILIRAVLSAVEGHRGEAWPFALLLAAAGAYEAVWLRFVRRAIESKRTIRPGAWTANVFAETLLPTAALFLQVHTAVIGPHRALTSPAALGYFLFIILSTLHLNPALSRRAGFFSAAGYASVSLYVFLAFPEVAAERLVAYGTSVAYAAFLLIGGLTAGAVAAQIRQHVLAALHEAETRARLAAIEHDLGIARAIQQNLLPKAPPHVEGFQIAGWNQSAAETGGDYFDWQPLSDGRLAVTIADVTGHGIGAALGMTSCRAYARAGFAIGLDLRDLTRRLNRLLCDDLPPDKFVTMAAGVLDPRDATLRLISAGHGPLIFYSAGEDRFHSLDAHGPPLGLLAMAPYGNAHEVKFAPGDMLVLVTDGCVEWANPGDEEFGQERLQEVIRACRHLPPDKIIPELYSAVVKFAGASPQADDLTVLVVKRG